MLLKRARAKKIKDSRNENTIEVSINNQKASSPSGKSTGKYETKPYMKSIDFNIDFINKTEFNLTINSFQNLEKLESFIKKKLSLKDVKQFGANALAALEIAILKVIAKEQKKQLWQIINPKARKIPIPVGNAIGGGLHSHNKDKPDFQEFLLIPKSNSIKENAKTIQKIHKKLKSILNAKEKNDEGAWQTSSNNEQVLELLKKFKNIRIGIDAATSSFYKKGFYHYKNKKLNKNQQINYINNLIKKYNLFYVEDPLHEEDFSGFAKINLSQNHLVVGDDLTATQISRLKTAIRYKSINAMIIKLNQNGSLIELKKILETCKKHNIRTILSHRSGETLDNALADLAVSFQADFIKCGIATKWREAKLKRLIEIENQIKK